MRMTAAVMYEQGLPAPYASSAPFHVEQVELDGPGEGEVLVEIHAAGLCHSDLSVVAGLRKRQLPVVGGHEGAGVVVEVGPGVTSVAPGDRVIPLYTAECRECKFCKSGKTNICTAIRAQQGEGYLPDGTARFSKDGQPIRHFMGTSTFAEYTVMPEIALAKVDPEASMEAICLLACGATTGIAAALWKAEVEAGSTVAVFGAGMVGLGAVVGAKLCGAERIIVLDPSEKRRQQALEFGATEVLAGGEDGAAQVIDRTDGLGADYTFEATGLVGVMGQAVEAARMGWGLCTVLGVAGKGETLDIIPRWLITGRKVQGGSFGGAKGRTHVPQLVDMYMDGKLDLDGFVSHRLSLDEVNRGFDLMHDQDGIRSVIKFD